MELGISEVVFFLRSWLLRFSRKYKKTSPPIAASKGMPIPRPTPRPTFKALALLAVAAALDNTDRQLGVEVLELGDPDGIVEVPELRLVVGVCCNLAVGTSVNPGAKFEPFCISPPVLIVN